VTDISEHISTVATNIFLEKLDAYLQERSSQLEYLVVAHISAKKHGLEIPLVEEPNGK